MITIEEIYKKLHQYGTFMTIDCEIITMNDLASLDFIYIEQNMDKIYDIIDWLHSSHMDSYIEVNETNARQIKIFLEWLIEIGKETSIKRGFIESMLNMFSINVNENLPEEEKISLPPYKYLKKKSVPADLDEVFNGIVRLK